MGEIHQSVPRYALVFVLCEGLLSEAIGSGGMVKAVIIPPLLSGILMAMVAWTILGSFLAEIVTVVEAGAG